MFLITKKKQLNENTVQMTIKAPHVARRALPGQFIIFRTHEGGERIPLTIASYDRESGEVTLIFQTVGASTSILGAKQEGESILDFVGPLGQASEFENETRVAVIGGGLGCAIAWPQAKFLHESGVEVDMICGFRNKDAVILEEEMKNSCQNLVLMTDDGSYGEKGLVTQGLKKLIEGGAKYSRVIAIGPPVMMKFVAALTKEYGIPTTVSMNPIMIDGTGMCGGCRVRVGGEYKFACVDGPDFDGHAVDFDELILRNRMYAEQENHHREETCNLLKQG
ncbi:MAG: sulfide/dihydroorotate dehydrogenase-like FAD/NAD-binding protein [Clostridia bacterium]|nr:sulfide/dihydroorotate dehydrogenase-like FAD/NAD-binding protein [Clostridia bacterium]